MERSRGLTCPHKMRSRRKHLTTHALSSCIIRCQTKTSEGLSRMSHPFAVSLFPLLLVSSKQAMPPLFRSLEVQSRSQVLHIIIAMPVLLDSPTSDRFLPPQVAIDPLLNHCLIIHTNLKSAKNAMGIAPLNEAVIRCYPPSQQVQHVCNSWDKFSRE